MYKLAIFDLDGTLLDTIKDLATACNHSLKKHNLPTYPVEDYKRFVGSGVFKLIERVVPTKMHTPLLIQSIKEEFDKYYGMHPVDFTKPYDGIEKMLECLQQQDIKIAVVSNKPHIFAVELVEKIFGKYIKDAYGHREGKKIKPDPSTVQEVMAKYQCKPSECIYIGDSDVDMFTAKNAGVKSVGVLWGFRTKEELMDAGAWKIVTSPEEIVDIFFENK